MQFSLCPICHRSAVTPSSDSLKCFLSVPSDFTIGEGASPVAGICLLLQPLTPSGVQAPCRFLSSSFSLLSFILPSYVGIFIVLSSVQALLLVFSWCSVRVAAPVDVFLMHPWRERNSTSPTAPPSWNSTTANSIALFYDEYVYFVRSHHYVSQGAPRFASALAVNGPPAAPHPPTV